jgi:hypothetical protein
MQYNLLLIIFLKKIFTEAKILIFILKYSLHTLETNMYNNPTFNNYSWVHGNKCVCIDIMFTTCLIAHFTQIFLHFDCYIIAFHLLWAYIKTHLKIDLSKGDTTLAKSDAPITIFMRSYLYLFCDAILLHVIGTESVTVRSSLSVYYFLIDTLEIWFWTIIW